MLELKTIVMLKSGRQITLIDRGESEITITDIQEVIAEDGIEPTVTGFDYDGNLIVIPRENIDFVSVTMSTIIE